MRLPLLVVARHSLTQLGRRQCSDCIPTEEPLSAGDLTQTVNGTNSMSDAAQLQDGQQIMLAVGSPSRALTSLLVDYFLSLCGQETLTFYQPLNLSLHWQEETASGDACGAWANVSTCDSEGVDLVILQSVSSAPLTF